MKSKKQTRITKSKDSNFQFDSNHLDKYFTTEEVVFPTKKENKKNWSSRENYRTRGML